MSKEDDLCHFKIDSNIKKKSYFVQEHCRDRPRYNAFCADPKTSRLISRYLRGLMGTFNDRAENLMDELTKLADSKKEAKMLQLVNRVTLDVITKVINPNICPPCDS